MLNEAFKQFQRLPDWPLARGKIGDSDGARANAEDVRERGGSWGGFGRPLRDVLLQDAEPQRRTAARL